MKTKQELKEAIRNGIRAYVKHVPNSRFNQLEIGRIFLNKYAERSLENKDNLRKILRKTKGWNEELDCTLVEKEVDYMAPVYDLHKMMWDGIIKMSNELKISIKLDDQTYSLCGAIAEQAYYPSLSRSAVLDDNNLLDVNKDLGETFSRILSGFKQGRKLSRVLNDLVKFQCMEKSESYNKWFAECSDAIQVKKKKITLFVSVNPAHFISMSNPKCDSRGEMLTSCHSFNQIDDENYSYCNGTIGYGSDGVTMIVFEVANPKDIESTFNRKIRRQLFMYNDGVLLQSRMYTSSGGTRGVDSQSEVYRKVVRDLIAEAEGFNKDNWAIETVEEENSFAFDTHNRFGGYPDYEYYNEFDITLMYQKDKRVNPLKIGYRGMCCVCGDDMDEYVVCEHCSHVYAYKCSNCGCGLDYDDVYRHDGESYCYDCFSEHYVQCVMCDEVMSLGSNDYIRDNRNNIVCKSCLEWSYSQCDHCGSMAHVNNLTDFYRQDGKLVSYCGNHEVMTTECLCCHSLNHIDRYICGDCGNYLWDKFEVIRHLFSELSKFDVNYLYSIMEDGVQGNKEYHEEELRLLVPSEAVELLINGEANKAIAVIANGMNVSDAVRQGLEMYFNYGKED